MNQQQTEDGQAEYIDAGEAVAAYRQAIANRDSARCQTEADVFQQQADKLRSEWEAYNGADDLAELATGEDELLT